MYNTSSIFAVNYQARAICAQKASKEKHRFLIGTCSLHDQNEISVLQYSEDSNHFEATSIYSHPDQIWCLETSPTDPSLVVTSRQNVNRDNAISLWKMPKQEAEDLEEDQHNYHHDILELNELSTFNKSKNPAIVNSVKWHNTENLLSSVDNATFTTWDIKDSQVSKKQSFSLSSLDAPASSSSTITPSYTLCSSAWDPHNQLLAAVTYRSGFHILDTREMTHKPANSQTKAHTGQVKDIDYNPNKSWTLITCGEDRMVKFWDARKLQSPLVSLTGHSHWILQAKYNPFHDQLILSGGSDSVVNLWRIASCSSTPWIGHSTTGGGDQLEDSLGPQGEEEEEDDPPNIKIRAMDQHEDSVYGLAWSPADAWIYCSLSYDGRAIINHVPSTEKYKILL